MRWGPDFQAFHGYEQPVFEVALLSAAIILYISNARISVFGKIVHPRGSYLNLHPFSLWTHHRSMQVLVPIAFECLSSRANVGGLMIKVGMIEYTFQQSDFSWSSGVSITMRIAKNIVDLLKRNMFGLILLKMPKWIWPWISWTESPCSLNISLSGSINFE